MNKKCIIVRVQDREYLLQEKYLPKLQEFLRTFKGKVRRIKSQGKTISPKKMIQDFSQ